MRSIWPFKYDYRIAYLNKDYTETIIGHHWPEQARLCLDFGENTDNSGRTISGTGAAGCRNGLPNRRVTQSTTTVA